MEGVYNIKDYERKKRLQSVYEGNPVILKFPDLEPNADSYSSKRMDYNHPDDPTYETFFRELNGAGIDLGNPVETDNPHENEAPKNYHKFKGEFPKKNLPREGA